MTGSKSFSLEDLITTPKLLIRSEGVKYLSSVEMYSIDAPGFLL
jgi:hypothetical protein